MVDIYEGLRSILTHKLLGEASVTGGESEAPQINFLVEVMQDYGRGVYSIAEVRNIWHQFPVPGFDPMAWIAANEEAGYFDPAPAA